jgi:hypothetical protein
MKNALTYNNDGVVAVNSNAGLDRGDSFLNGGKAGILRLRYIQLAPIYFSHRQKPR